MSIFNEIYKVTDNKSEFLKYIDTVISVIKNNDVKINFRKINDMPQASDSIFIRNLNDLSDTYVCFMSTDQLNELKSAIRKIKIEGLTCNT